MGEGRRRDDVRSEEGWQDLTCLPNIQGRHLIGFATGRLSVSQHTQGRKPVGSMVWFGRAAATTTHIYPFCLLTPRLITDFHYSLLFGLTTAWRGREHGERGLVFGAADWWLGSPLAFASGIGFCFETTYLPLRLSDRREDAGLAGICCLRRFFLSLGCSFFIFAASS